MLLHYAQYLGAWSPMVLPVKRFRGNDVSFGLYSGSFHPYFAHLNVIGRCDAHGTIQ